MKTNQRGFSLIELLIVVAIILIIAAIAIPNLLRARISANEASSVASLRTMNTACITFNSTYGQYPPALTNLGPVTPGATPNSNSSDLLDSILGGQTTPLKSGYTFSYSSAAPFQSYTINADPQTQNQTGIRHFFTDQSGVIRWNGAVSATLTDVPLQ